MPEQYTITSVVNLIGKRTSVVHLIGKRTSVVHLIGKRTSVVHLIGKRYWMFSDTLWWTCIPTLEKRWFHDFQKIKKWTFVAERKLWYSREW